MDVQLALLSKIVLQSDLRLVVNARITADFFTDDRYLRIYQYMLDHWRTYSVSPDEAVMHTAFPNMTWEDFPQPIEYFIDQLRERRKRSILVEGLSTAAAFFQNDDPGSVLGMEEAITDALRRARVETSPANDIDFTNARAEVMQLLDDRMDNPGYLRGISTGFDGIDYVTGGLQPQHFIVLIGTIKSFKSATALAMMLAVHRQAKSPMFIGFEMSNTEQQDRALSLLSSVSLSKIMNGNLNVKERRRVDDAMAQLEGMRSMIFSSDIQSATTVAGVQAKVHEYEPDVVFIDGAYLMRSELIKAEAGSAQALTDISRSLKRLAQSSKIPVVVTTQASFARSKGGLSGHSAAYTQAWAQDADVLLGVERIGDRQTDESNSFDPVRVKFRVLESRSGPRKEVILEWDWHKGSVNELDPVVMAQRLDRERRATSYTTEDGSEDWGRP